MSGEGVMLPYEGEVAGGGGEVMGGCAMFFCLRSKRNAPRCAVFDAVARMGGGGCMCEWLEVRRH